MSGNCAEIEWNEKKPTKSLLDCLSAVALYKYFIVVEIYIGLW